MPRRSSREFRPAVARLESREVPTVISPLAFGGMGLPGPRVHASSIVIGSGGGDYVGAVGSPNQIPTARELAREVFVNRYTRVQVGVGVPATVDQARQFLYAGSGGGNMSIASRLVMRLFTPIDPNGAVTGLAQLRDRSIGTSASALVLTLTGSTAGLDAQGRPTRLTWTANSNLSGGSYTSAIGSGTVAILYGPNRDHHPHGGGNAGSASVIFRGLVRTTGGVTDLTKFEVGHF